MTSRELTKRPEPKAIAALVVAAMAAGTAGANEASSQGARAERITLVVHGGSGTITKQTITPALEAQYRAALERALLAGHAVLSRNGSSVDAVVAALRVFEDDPLFNAGKGAVFTHEGKNELDASIMDGKTGLAGAVAGATGIKNPIVAAKAVMDKTKHVLLSGAGADKFAAEQKLEMVDPSYFFTQHRWDQLQKAKELQQIQLDHDGKHKAPPTSLRSDAQGASDLWMVDHKYGTVGAVALDAFGNLAAGTSTGGLTNKLYGRVGDSPMIGAGTYASNDNVAVSATGAGEFFMRSVVAYDIAARMRYGRVALADAVDQAISSALTAKQGRGGVIALDKDGNVKFGFNTEGMYRGYILGDAKPVVQIYRE